MNDFYIKSRMPEGRLLFKALAPLYVLIDAIYRWEFIFNTLLHKINRVMGTEHL